MAVVIVRIIAIMRAKEGLTFQGYTEPICSCITLRACTGKSIKTRKAISGNERTLPSMMTPSDAFVQAGKGTVDEIRFSKLGVGNV